MLDELVAIAGSPLVLLYAVGLSLSGLGIAGELVVATITRRRLYGLADTFANLALYSVHRARRRRRLVLARR